MTDLMILNKLAEIKEGLDNDTVLGFSNDGKAIRVENIHVLNLSNSDIKEIPEIIWHLNGLETLNLSGLQLTALPERIGDLRNLQILDVSGTQLTTLPERIGNLRKLKSLNVSNTQLIKLPEEIGGLINLETLNASGTQLETLPEMLGSLHWLQTLDVSKSKLTILPDNIGSLRNLQTLDVSGTLLSTLPESIKYMDWLQSLDASDTQLAILPSSIGNVEWLQNLNISGTKLTTLPESIGNLSGLQTLNVSRTNLTTLPESIGNLRSLRKLDVSAIQIMTLPEGIRNLKNLSQLNISGTKVNGISALSGLSSLTSLNLQNSKIITIPESIIDLNLRFIIDKYDGDEWRLNPGIYIHNLTISDQPIETFLQSNELIRSSSKEIDMVPINECKVIFLGDAESGKTHSIRRLLNKGEYLDDFEGESTPGIEITVSQIKLEDSDIVVNYWDFGGQEIQHSMHRVFLTDRTVYVVFLNARQDDLMDERARYWMENIKAFAPNAPVLVVINKIDQNDHPRFNEKGFRDSYSGQVKKVIRISAKIDRPRDFLDKLQGSINSIIMELPIVSKMIPRSWKNLMENIRVMQDPYITTEQFLFICKLNNIVNYEEIHNELVDLFQVLGVCFCYYNNRTIADYMLLNPNWMLNALYTIVTNGKAISKNGVITQNDLFDLLQKDTIKSVRIRRVIPDLRYKGFEINYILGVVRMFGLSYCMKDGSEFFPMLCDGDEKISIKKAVPDNALHFIFRYAYLPTNVIHRLIVEMQRDIDYRYVWYTGAVFRNTQQNQTAYIHSVGNDLHIYVYGDDKYYNLNEYMTPISNIVRDINQRLGISAAEFLTYRSDSGEAEIPLKRVIGNLCNGIDKEYNETVYEIIHYDVVARRYFDDRPKADDILNSVVYALQKMQNDKTYYRTEEHSRGLEDSRNRFVSLQLGAVGYLCSDQQTGGTSLISKVPGERDFVVKDKYGVDVLIYEALNLKNFEGSYINQHIQKLINNYNPMGMYQSVLVTYLECDRDKFKGFTDKYREHISEYAPEPFHCIGKPEDIHFACKYLSCMKMKYEVGGLYFVIYHIVVRVAP